MMDAIVNTGAGVFGSGWSWLALSDGKLVTQGVPGGEDPLAHGATPLCGIDVWEHAYYLDYQNRRPDYITTYLEKLVDWNFVAANFAAA